MQRAEADPRAQELAEEWRTCMSGRGLTRGVGRDGYLRAMSWEYTASTLDGMTPLEMTRTAVLPDIGQDLGRRLGKAWVWGVTAVVEAAIGPALPPVASWGPPWEALLPLILVVLVVVASMHPRRTTAGVWVVTTLLLVPASLLDRASLTAVILFAGLLGLLTVLGDTIRTRSLARTRLSSTTAEAQQGLAREAVLRERAHIARELHE